MTKENPLVSIIVITYNSAKYILETLESAKAQTYQNIELIVSDDCSTDNTVELSRKWIEHNKERFIRTESSTVKRNTGIAPNSNRGLFKATGEWVKFIAGDDILLNTCIEKNIMFAIENPTANIIFSGIILFGNDKPFGNKGLGYFKNDIFHYNVKQQFQFLVMKSNCIPAASGFLKRKIIMELGAFDERIRLLEDYPMWIKATKNGYQLYYFDNYTVKYRLHDNSISQSNLSKSYYKSQYLTFIYYILPVMVKKNPFKALDYFIILKSRYVSSKAISYLFVLLRLLSPYAFYKLFSNLFKGRFLKGYR